MSNTTHLNLGGADRKIRLTPLSFRLAKDHGVRIPTSEMGSMEMLPTLLWISLLHADETVTEAQVLDWLRQTTVDEEMEIYQAVTQAAEAMRDGMARANPRTPAARKSR